MFLFLHQLYFLNQGRIGLSDAFVQRNSFQSLFTSVTVEDCFGTQYEANIFRDFNGNVYLETDTSLLTEVFSFEKPSLVYISYRGNGFFDIGPNDYEWYQIHFNGPHN